MWLDRGASGKKRGLKENSTPVARSSLRNESHRSWSTLTTMHGDRKDRNKEHLLDQDAADEHTSDDVEILILFRLRVVDEVVGNVGPFARVRINPPSEKICSGCLHVLNHENRPLTSATSGDPQKTGWK